MHYVLDAGGHVLDGIPGLVSADAFVASLEESLNRRSLMSAERTEDIAHQTWRSGLIVAAESSPASGNTFALAPDGQRPAERAMSLTVGKALVETPPLQAILTETSRPWSTSVLNRILPPAERAMALSFGKREVEAVTLQALLTAAPQPPDTTSLSGPAPMSNISPASRNLMRLQNPDLTEPDFDRMVNTFREGLASDTTRNLTDLQPKLRRLLAEYEAPAILATFNARVYDDIFSTPLNDPWMGLDTPGTYTGLIDGGLVTPRKESNAAPPRQTSPAASDLEVRHFTPKELKLLIEAGC